MRIVAVGDVRWNAAPRVFARSERAGIIRGADLHIAEIEVVGTGTRIGRHQPLGTGKALVDIFGADFAPADVVCPDEVHLSIGAKGAAGQSGRIVRKRYESLFLGVLLCLVTDLRDLQTISVLVSRCRSRSEGLIARVFPSSGQAFHRIDAQIALSVHKTVGAFRRFPIIMPDNAVPGEPFNRQLVVIRLFFLVRIHDGEIITGAAYSPVSGTRITVVLAIHRVLGDHHASFGAVIARVRHVIEKGHASVIAGLALAGRAQPQAAAEMTGVVPIRGRIGHIADRVLFGVYGAAQTVGPVVHKRALLEHGLAVPRHEDGATVLHGTVGVEQATVDDHAAVVRRILRAVAEVDGSAAGRVQRGVVHLPVTAEGTTVDHQMPGGPDRATTCGTLPRTVIVDRVTDVVRELATVDGKRTIAPDCAATMKINVVRTVFTGMVPIERATVDGHDSGRAHDRATRSDDANGRIARSRVRDVVLENTAVDGQIAVAEHVGDIAVAAGVAFASVVAVHTAVDDRGSFFTCGTDLHQSAVWLVAEAEFVGLIRVTADGEGRPSHNVEQGIVVGTRIAQSTCRGAGVIVGDQGDVPALIHRDLAAERNIASNADYAALVRTDRGDGIDQFVIVRNRYRRTR